MSLWWLWFDVGKETYTTYYGLEGLDEELWFDVGKETYTTIVYTMLAD